MLKEATDLSTGSEGFIRLLESMRRQMSMLGEDEKGRQKLELRRERPVGVQSKFG